MLLRPATDADLPELTAWESDPDTATWLGVTGAAWHGQAMADPHQEDLVAVDAGAPIGFAVLAGLDTDAIELRRMVIAPSRRGGGHGRALLRAVIAHVASRYPDRGLWLDVKSGNRRARALYLSEGFSVTGMQAAAMTEPDGSSTDLVVMAHRGNG